MLLNGSEILVQCLREQGVDTIFGYPGGAVLNIYDALFKHRDEIKHYLTSHEQGAAHAADGYARATGKVGVCLATSGPGACNLVTGIATAYMDSVPMVAITGNVGLPYLGKDSFQEVDITGVTMPITKHNFIVKDVTKLADTMRKAFYIAQKGRPGPVLVDITKDVTAAMCEYTAEKPYRIEKRTSTITKEDLEKAVELIKNAKKPFLYCGGGCIASSASEEIIKFVEKTDMPVCCTAMALGVVPADLPNYTGMIGMHGTVTSNKLANECDLFIALGARFSDRVATNFKTFAPNAKVLHIDIDPAEINKNIDVKIDDKDLRIDIYRSSGPGGQGVNTTDSAVRITHIPTGIVVTCQNERSQIRNKEKALEILKNKLYLVLLDKQSDDLNAIRGEQLTNGFGSAKRSYVMCPYTLVKDNDSGYENSNVNDILDGNIDDMIEYNIKFSK